MSNADNNWFTLLIDQFTNLNRDPPKYLSWKNFPEKLNFSCYTMPNNSRILIFGDWGTGL